MKTENNEAYMGLLDQLGLTHAEASRFLDIHERTSRRWETGKAQPPPELLMLLHLMVARRISPAKVREIAGFPPVVFYDRRFKRHRDRPVIKRELARPRVKAAE